MGAVDIIAAQQGNGDAARLLVSARMERLCRKEQMAGRQPGLKLGPNAARSTLIAIGGLAPEILLGEEWNGKRAKSWQTKELAVVPTNLSVQVADCLGLGQECRWAAQGTCQGEEVRRELL